MITLKKAIRIMKNSEEFEYFGLWCGEEGIEAGTILPNTDDRGVSCIGIMSADGEAIWRALDLIDEFRVEGHETVYLIGSSYWFDGDGVDERILEDGTVIGVLD